MSKSQFFGYGVMFVRELLQLAQDSAPDALQSTDGWWGRNHEVRASARIGYMQNGQAVIEETIELASPSLLGNSGLKLKLETAQDVAQLSGTIAKLLRDSINDRGRVYWVTIQDDANNGEEVIDYSATAYFDSNGQPQCRLDAPHV